MSKSYVLWKRSQEERQVLDVITGEVREIHRGPELTYSEFLLEEILSTLERTAEYARSKR